MSTAARSMPIVARPSPLVIACLAATWFVWGSTYLAIKFALVSFPPFFQMGTRFVVAGTVLLCWAVWGGQKLPTLAQWRNAAIVGALMLCGGMGGTAFAEQTVASGLVVAFIAILPALITIASLPFGLKPSRLEMIGIGVGLAGVLLLVRGEAFGASSAGLIAIVTATVCWSIGSVLSQHVFPLATGETFHWPPGLLATASWGYLVVFGSLIAFVAYMVLLANTTPALAASYSFVNPVIALMLGISLGGETVTQAEWLAVGIIVAGVFVLVLGRR